MNMFFGLGHFFCDSLYFLSSFLVSTTSTVVSVSSKLSSLKAQIDEDDVKSIFVGATKYEILNYLEDAKERGVDNLTTDLGTGIEGMFEI